MNQRRPVNCWRSENGVLQGRLINQTEEKLSGLILRVKAYNKSNKTLVTEEVVTLPISIFPTVKKSISVAFDSSSVGEAKAQLDNNFSWNYELIAYLPDHLFTEPSIWNGANYDWLAE